MTLFKGKNHKIGGTVLGIAALLGMTAAQAVVLDFEGYAAGTIIDDELSGVTVSAETNSAGSPNAAVVFDTENPTGGDRDLGAPFISAGGSQEEFSPGNVLILQERGPCDASSCETPDDDLRGGVFSFVFELPIILDSIDFFDIEQDESGSPIKGYDVVAMGNGGTPIGMWSVPATGGDNTWTRLDFEDAAGIVQLDIHMAGSGAIDNIDYTIIPLPAAIWLLGSALIGLVGFGRRRS